MAQFITLPTAQPTGYGQLGQVLMAGAGDYAAEKRRSDEEVRVRANQLEDAARNRSNQLADIGSAREYSDKRYATERADRLKDTEAEKMFAAKTELMRLGYLTPDKFDDAEAVKLALTKMHSDGLLQKYQGALGSGDLTYEDLSTGDEKKINVGLKKFSERLGAQTARAESNVASGSAQAADVQRKMRALEQQESTLANQIVAFERNATTRPSAKDIEIRAAEIAAPLAKTRGRPTDDEIARSRPEAEQSILKEKQENMFSSIQANKEQINLLRQQQMALTAQSDALTRQGMYAPKEMFAEPSAPSISAPPQAKNPGPTLDQIKATLARKYGGGTPSGVPTSAPTPTSNPELVPLPHAEVAPIAAENKRRAAIAQSAQMDTMAGQQQALSDPYNESLDRIDQLQKRVSILSDPNYAQSHPLLSGPYQSKVGYTPQQQAEELSSALTALDAEKQTLEQRRRAMLHLQDPTVAAATPQIKPPFSDAASTTPFPVFGNRGVWFDKSAQASGF